MLYSFDASVSTQQQSKHWKDNVNQSTRSKSIQSEIQKNRSHRNSFFHSCFGISLFTCELHIHIWIKFRPKRFNRSGVLNFQIYKLYFACRSEDTWYILNPCMVWHIHSQNATHLHVLLLFCFPTHAFHITFCLIEEPPMHDVTTKHQDFNTPPYYILLFKALWCSSSLSTFCGLKVRALTPFFYLNTLYIPFSTEQGRSA